jgi:hypothetical protein
MDKKFIKEWNNVMKKMNQIMKCLALFVAILKYKRWGNL